MRHTPPTGPRPPVAPAQSHSVGPGAPVGDAPGRSRCSAGLANRSTGWVLAGLAVALPIGTVLLLHHVAAQPPAVVVLGVALVQSLLGNLALTVWSLRRLEADHLARGRLVREERDGARAESRARSDFLGTLSHELRTPLSAVVGMSEQLLADEPDVVRREHLGQVHRSGLVVLDLITNVLDRTTLDADRLSLDDHPLELPALLGDVAEQFGTAAQTKGIRLVTRVDPACPDWVRGDATRLRQVLTNLLSNAVKFTDRGEVRLDVSPTQPEVISFRVTDTGTGIADGELDRLFQPYGQIREPREPRRGGTGLGLSISQSLVHQMGGQIRVTSRAGVGSVFGFELVLPAEPVPESVASALTGRRVVVVDQQPSRAERAAVQLRRWGAEVEVAGQVDLAHTDPTVLVMVREDRADALAELGDQLQRHAGARRPALLVVTPSLHAVPNRQLGPEDRVVDCSGSGGRLRSTLESMRHPRPDPPTSGATHEPTQLRILLAEDDPVSRRVCQIMVEQLGHRVDVVGDGAAAVTAAAGGGYDLVLMDSQMPTMNGVDTTRAIRAGGGPGALVPVVALTGATTATDRAAYAAAGMDAVLTKPVSRSELAETLDTFRQRSAAAVQAS